MSPPAFHDLADLASERLGGAVLYATDDYFAGKENLLRPSPPVWKEHEYTDRGKWMDGWESRRKREPGHDFAVIRLGAPGIVRGVVVDTSFFRGNYPAQCSIEGCSAAPESDVPSLLGGTWSEILPITSLQGDAANEFEVSSPHAFTHLRLHIYPDGGVARLRVHGEVLPEWRRSGGLGGEADLAAIENGAEVLTCSDMFFGPKHNLIMPGRAHNMSDGWETRRRRGPGHDWVIVQLATEGVVRRVEVDTSHFKGNYPDTCSIEASSDGSEWHELLPRTKLQAHTRHLFLDELLDAGAAKQLRLNVYPDGGVSRLRAFGVATDDGRKSEVVKRVNALVPERAQVELRSCCGQSEWVRRMIDARPFASWDALVSTAESIWFALDAAGWREAFAAHPRIGERGGSRWSRAEQTGATSAGESTLTALATANREYEQRFGHVFLVCATGKSAEEMLAMVGQRMQHEPDDELRIAAAEQMKITKLRLMKLVTG